jgi:hypothetical protein
MGNRIMKHSLTVMVIAALAALAACNKSNDTAAASDPTPTVTETIIDETPTIVEEETTRPPIAVDGPAMDSVQEGMPPAKGAARKK